MGDHKLVYIMGLGRSGSTLLAMLLNAHPQMVSLGEVRGPRARWKNLGDYPCSCGVPVGGCPFWTKLAEAMRSRGVLRSSALVERWRERLDADQVEEILRRTEPVRRRYGYV